MASADPARYVNGQLVGPNGPFYRALAKGLALGLVGAVALGFGISWFMRNAVGAHITDCGFDAKSAYTKVRVNNFWDGASEQTVHVVFSLKGSGDVFAGNEVTVQVPALGHGTAVVHGQFPQAGRFRGADYSRSSLNWDDKQDLKVVGHIAYLFVPARRAPGRLVSKTFAEQHRNRVAQVTVPDDPSILNCSITGDGW